MRDDLLKNLEDYPEDKVEKFRAALEDSSRTLHSASLELYGYGEDEW